MSFRPADAIFWIAVACCCFAQLAIVHSIVKAARGGDGPLGRRAAEVVWAVIPAVALAAVFLFTWRAMHREPAATAIVTAVSAR